VLADGKARGSSGRSCSPWSHSASCTRLPRLPPRARDSWTKGCRRWRPCCCSQEPCRPDCRGGNAQPCRSAWQRSPRCVSSQSRRSGIVTTPMLPSSAASSHRSNRVARPGGDGHGGRGARLLPRPAAERFFLFGHPGVGRAAIMHLPGLALIERRAFWPLLFTSPSKQPLTFSHPTPTSRSARVSSLPARGCQPLRGSPRPGRTVSRELAVALRLRRCPLRRQAAGSGCVSAGRPLAGRRR